MIKFFRKIRQQLLSENKFSKYLMYALGEIVLVVIGILIALQINILNEQRKNNNKEAVILKALHRDFSRNLSDFNRIKQMHINTLQKQDIVLRNVPRLSQPEARDSISKNGASMFVGVTYNASNGVVESLISSGDINLISNDTLKNYLVSWRDVLVDYTEEEYHSAQLWENTIQPYLIEKGIFYAPTQARNFALLRDTVFLSMLVRKRFLTNHIVSETEGPNSIEQYLKEIVRLSDANHQK